MVGGSCCSWNFLHNREMVVGGKQLGLTVMITLLVLLFNYVHGYVPWQETPLPRGPAVPHEVPSRFNVERQLPVESIFVHLAYKAFAACPKQ